MDTSFTNHWDIMPAKRMKFAHNVGAVCPFEINISNHSPYTGLLKPGKVEGFIRLGTGSDLTSPSDPGMTIGAAMKFLRSGTHSGNALFSYTTLPNKDDNFDFFGFYMSNHAPVDSPDGVSLSRLLGSVMTGVKYCETKSCVTKVGISDLSFYDQDGNFEDQNPDFPFKIDIHPYPKFKSEKPASMKDFIAQFKALPIGTKLYSMKAIVDPNDKEGLVLGDVVTIDHCVSSYFGDTKLFFRHQWLEEDIALRPEWTEAYKHQCFCDVQRHDW